MYVVVELAVKPDLYLRFRNEAGAVQNYNTIDDWKQKDVEARTLIYSTMKPEKQTTLQSCTTAFEMWSRIQTEYDLVSAESEPLLWGQFYGYRFRAGKNN
jgi:hypothetical protein